MKVPFVLIGAIAGVTACGDSSATATGTGRVEYLVNGGPVVGAKVRVGNGPVQTTDADGGFVVDISRGAYDVAAVSAEGKAATVYVGLTRKDPTVSIPLEGPGEEVVIHAALVTGRFVGGIGVPIPLGHQAAGFFTGPEAAAARIANTSLNPDGTYTILLNWRGDSTLTGTLRVVEWLIDSSGFPASFDAADSIPITIASGQTLTGKDIHFAAVGNLRITGTTSVAPGYVLIVRLLTASFPPSGFLDLGLDASQPAFDFPAFNLPGAVFNLTALAQDSRGAIVQGWRAGFTPGNPVAQTLPSAPVFQPPGIAAAGGAAGTTLSWTPLASAVYDLTVQSQVSTTVLRVVTGGTTFQLPDLSALGFQWPTAASYDVGLLASAPLSPDDVAGGTSVPPRDHDGVVAVAASIAVTP